MGPRDKIFAAQQLPFTCWSLEEKAIKISDYRKSQMSPTKGMLIRSSKNFPKGFLL